jgi:hypothetical protein
VEIMFSIALLLLKNDAGFIPHKSNGIASTKKRPSGICRIAVQEENR